MPTTESTCCKGARALTSPAGSSAAEPACTRARGGGGGGQQDPSTELLFPVPGIPSDLASAFMALAPPAAASASAEPARPCLLACAAIALAEFAWPSLKMCALQPEQRP
ncbi:unnamed protein product [Symbiodinium necroappetens]|uniref:Uncharacterized protein n=1 Tax=Symbiodinium necroappetens TaxID=1628268 RepID=A0A813BC16_9DINO|nr:unnamed protein product [Symbiodinium necroappetens]